MPWLSQTCNRHLCLKHLAQNCKRCQYERKLSPVSIMQTSVCFLDCVRFHEVLATLAFWGEVYLFAGFAGSKEWCERWYLHCCHFVFLYCTSRILTHRARALQARVGGGDLQHRCNSRHGTGRVWEFVCCQYKEIMCVWLWNGYPVTYIYVFPEGPSMPQQGQTADLCTLEDVVINVLLHQVLSNNQGLKTTRTMYW